MGWGRRDERESDAKPKDPPVSAQAPSPHEGFCEPGTLGTNGSGVIGGFGGD